MRIFLTWLTWLLIVNFNASTWAQNAEIPTGVRLSFEDEMAELNRLKESAQLHEIIKFLDAHGLDMISRVKSEEATRLAFTIMGAVRAGRARSTSRHCKLQTNTTTKSCLASFEARKRENISESKWVPCWGKVNINDYGWKPHCPGLFQTPISA